MSIKEIIENKNYKAFVGNQNDYEKIGKTVFDCCIKQGLKKDNNMLDIGCGSLRVGKYLMEFLEKGKYHGIELNYWLIEEAAKNDKQLLKILNEKQPFFNIGFDFGIDTFSKKFDFILAHSIFIHACIRQIENIIDKVKENSNEGCIFLFNFKEGKDNELNTWSYPEAVTYTKQTIEGLLAGLNYSYIKGWCHTWIKVLL